TRLQQAQARRFVAAHASGSDLCSVAYPATGLRRHGRNGATALDGLRGATVTQEFTLGRVTRA
ncbi:MAG TPA: hypothetical protein VEH76_11220, partial [Methylocystis sp.]|nr:hypothetical protein [Methylocystis sp.]